MGVLDNLWDDAVARLGKLRKNAAVNSTKEVMNDRRSLGEDGVRVSRSIMIVKPQQGSEKDSPPVSPAGFTPPASPFAGYRKVEGGRKRSVSGGDDDEHNLRLHTRSVELVEDTGALLLLTTCDM